MTFDSFLATLLTPALMLPLLGSLITGALIGAEREVQAKPAGLRTHTLVCFGSALMMLIAAHQSGWDSAFLPETQIVSDLSRMPHAILTGIGFLGAGVIFREGLSVQGLTTAASLWLTASLGIVYGAGMLELAIVGTLIVLAVLIVLRVLNRVLPVHTALRVTLRTTPDFRSGDLAQVLARHRLKPGPLAFAQTPQDLTLTTIVTLPGRHVHLDELAADLRANPAVQDITFQPVDQTG
ncbi:MgtC/SapB family protein [Pseudorhodobacter sp. MZDSW-24AT]|uniref:MgtC/SapB family protein n=1 Tax=Pseudorhodobacter sp. MZDSW-24AT TaxID=2052957 RepID=UPI000C1E57AA|nr:MgtC/SapB family protein [Pseudorhodobacter sp. MZDSW-24AT]PJF09767.1 magnesium transporter [Pseudorhodobacter sp. MZDSW-24AT]